MIIQLPVVEKNAGRVLEVFDSFEAGLLPVRITEYDLSETYEPLLVYVFIDRTGAVALRDHLNEVLAK